MVGGGALHVRPLRLGIGKRVENIINNYIYIRDYDNCGAIFD
jgi:hypothetical protein